MKKPQIQRTWGYLLLRSGPGVLRTWRYRFRPQLPIHGSE
jgi:hypothetical protein